MSGKPTFDASTVTDMNGPLKLDPRYGKAACRGMWFAAVFAFICIVLAALSWAGTTGKPEHAPILLVMALVGVVLFILSRFIVRSFLD